MRSDITPGQTSDYLGFDLVMGDNLPEPCVLLADRGYDSDKLRETMEARNVVPVRECLKLCVSDPGHAVFRYGQASKRPANIMAS